MLGGVTNRPDGLAAPVAVALDVVQLLKAGRYQDAWTLTDPEWHQGEMQSWLWQSLDVGASEYDEEEASRYLADPRPWWSDFVQDRSRFWADRVQRFEPRTWGPLNATRPIKVDYELVLLIKTGGEELVLRGPTMFPPQSILNVIVHVTAGQSLVAAVDSPRYVPGWPPTIDEWDVT